MSRDLAGNERNKAVFKGKTPTYDDTWYVPETTEYHTNQVFVGKQQNKVWKSGC